MPSVPAMSLPATAEAADTSSPDPAGDDQDMGEVVDQINIEVGTDGDPVPDQSQTP